jgi:hypothetical protein
MSADEVLLSPLHINDELKVRSTFVVLIQDSITWCVCQSDVLIFEFKTGNRFLNFWSAILDCITIFDRYATILFLPAVKLSKQNGIDWKERTWKTLKFCMKLCFRSTWCLKTFFSANFDISWRKSQNVQKCLKSQI